MGDACQWLLDGRLDAVVYDRPSLQYYARNKGHNRVEMVSRLFSPQDYAMALPHGSPLRKPLNQALLELQEDGAVEKIRTRWFGSEP